MRTIASLIYDFAQKYCSIRPVSYEHEIREVLRCGGDFSGKRVLEIGAGTCRVSAQLKNLYPTAQVTATDISRSHLASGNKKADIRTIVSPTETLWGKVKPGFDVIIGVDTIHHHQNRVVALGNCYKLLKPGGILLLRDVSRLLPGFTLYKIIDKSDFIYTILQGMRFTDPSYLSHDEFIDLLTYIGFRETSVTPLHRSGLIIIKAKKPGRRY